MMLETKMIAEYGVTLDGVWFPYGFLLLLLEQARYESEWWGKAFIVATRDQERVLLAHNLAVKETKGGLHSSDTDLPAFMAAIEWPQDEGTTEEKESK
jgi:hypothetical protein